MAEEAEIMAAGAVRRPGERWEEEEEEEGVEGRKSPKQHLQPPPIFQSSERKADLCCWAVSSLKLPLKVGFQARIS